MKFLREFTMFCLMILLPIGLIFFVLLLLCSFAEQRSCNIYSEVTGKQTIYRHFDQCFIETDRGFQRLDEYQSRIIASEGLTNTANLNK